MLIIKTAWGGRDFYKDFRPPSAGGTVGPFYTDMIGTVRKVLSSLDTSFPKTAAVAMNSRDLSGGMVGMIIAAPPKEPRPMR